MSFKVLTASLSLRKTWPCFVFEYLYFQVIFTHTGTYTYIGTTRNCYIKRDFYNNTLEVPGVICVDNEQKLTSYAEISISEEISMSIGRIALYDHSVRLRHVEHLQGGTTCGNGPARRRSSDWTKII